MSQKQIDEVEQLLHPQPYKEAMFHGILDCLNSAFEADPAAIHALLVNRVPVNEALRDHPLIPVDPVPLSDRCMLGALGLINGVLAAASLPLVAARFADPEEPGGPRKLEGFQRYAH